MIPAVTGLRQTSQTGQATSFAWNADTEADTFTITVDGTQAGSVSADAAVVTAVAGNHTLGVIPVAKPTPPTVVGFTVTTNPPPPPPPPASGFPTAAVVIGGLGVLAVAGIAIASRDKFLAPKEEVLG